MLPCANTFVRLLSTMTTGTSTEFCVMSVRNDIVKPASTSRSCV